MMISSISAGFLACVVGYSSSAILVFQAALLLGLTPLEASAWLGVLCVALGILTVVFSIRFKIPIMFAWSTAGAALLLTGVNHETLSDTYGSFLISAFLLFFTGITGFFEYAIKKFPASIAQAMLAGILLQFALGAFQAIDVQKGLVLTSLFIYLVFKKIAPRFAIVIVAVAGFLIAYAMGLVQTNQMTLELAVPHFVRPTFQFHSIVSLAVPLFLVTLTSQNMAGIATLHAHNYKVDISKVITWSGLVNILTAPFGGFTVNLSAVTASICMGPEAHRNPQKRYWAAVSYGVFFIITGIFAGTIGLFFIALPKPLVAVVTGLALFGAITNGLTSAVKNESDRDAAMITFFITASGIIFMGIGSAFWGILGGGLTHFVLGLGKARQRALS